MNTAIYFVAIVPGPEISREVTAFKRYAADHFFSSRALNSPPHITLFPPFIWPLDRQRDLIDSLSKFSKSQKAFFLLLQNFNHFGNRVIFVDVNLSPELQDIEKALKIAMKEDLDLPFTGHAKFKPHMTVAFKDLQAEYFPAAWSYFSKIQYDRFFTVGDICLLKHNKKTWDIHKRFKLKDV